MCKCVQEGNSKSKERKEENELVLLLLNNESTSGGKLACLTGQLTQMGRLRGRQAEPNNHIGQVIIHTVWKGNLQWDSLSHKHSLKLSTCFNYIA